MRLLPQPSSDSPPMFESKLVDRFSRTHWSIVPILYGPATLALLGVSIVHGEVPWYLTLPAAFGGFVAWTLAEYWLHRTFFHWKPGGWLGEKMHFVVHGVHHKWPRDKYRLVMPPAVSMTLFWVFLALFVGTMGRWGWAFSAGFTFGYMFYDCTHYFLHHSSPKRRFTKALRKHHLAHHSPKLADERKFGVSTTLWDHVFRTY